jgi:hypothetical protein
MGKFSDIDIELTYGSKPKRMPREGSFGVSINDPNNPPMFYELLTIMGNVGLFWPNDGSGDIVQFSLDDYWELT